MRNVSYCLLQQLQFTYEQRERVSAELISQFVEVFADVIRAVLAADARVISEDTISRPSAVCLSLFLSVSI